MGWCWLMGHRWQATYRYNEAPEGWWWEHRKCQRCNQMGVALVAGMLDGGEVIIPPGGLDLDGER